MTMKKKNYKFETLQVTAGQEIDPVSKGTAVPI
jgi:O-acetylhomoserine/O-acetylserine sulfhydrylase-like pyridoxal-dependent enzyme